VPGAPFEWNELHQITASSNQEVRRYANISDLCKIRMGVPIEAIGEKRFDKVPTVLTRRQADPVENNQVRMHARWPVILIRRRAL
jgi:hypothetical protein